MLVQYAVWKIKETSDQFAMNINYAVAHKCQFAHGAEYKKFYFWLFWGFAWRSDLFRGS